MERIKIGNILMTTEDPEGNKETGIGFYSFTREEWEHLNNGEEIEKDGWFYSCPDPFDHSGEINLIQDALDEDAEEVIEETERRF